MRSAIPRRLGATFAVEIDGLANQMNTQWLMIQQRFGKSITTEFIKESKVGDSFIQYTYLHTFDSNGWLTQCRGTTACSSFSTEDQHDPLPSRETEALRECASLASDVARQRGAAKAR